MLVSKFKMMMAGSLVGLVLIGCGNSSRSSAAAGVNVGGARSVSLGATGSTGDFANHGGPGGVISPGGGVPIVFNPVAQGELASITISPIALTLTVSTTGQLIITGNLVGGGSVTIEPSDDVEVTYSTTGGVVSVDSDGLVTALTTGTAIVNVRVVTGDQTLQDSVTVTVNSGTSGTTGTTGTTGGTTSGTTGGATSGTTGGTTSGTSGGITSGTTGGGTTGGVTGGTSGGGGTPVVTVLPNGNFSTSALPPWTSVILASGSFTGFPHFEIHTTTGGLLPAQEGNPFFLIDVPGGASGFIHQMVTIPTGSNVLLRYRVWGGLDPVNAFVSAGALRDNFVPPPLENNSGGPSGNTDQSRSLNVTSLQGQTVDIQMGGTSTFNNGTAASFDDLEFVTTP